MSCNISNSYTKNPTTRSQQGQRGQPEKDKEEKSNIENKLYIMRGVQVMLDSDLAELFNTETKFINRAVKRNASRFPIEFMFQLTEQEWQNLRFQSGTSSEGHGGRRYYPNAFTEQGIAMLSAVLHVQILQKRREFEIAIYYQHY